MSEKGEQTLLDMHAPMTDFTALFEAARSETERKALEQASAFCQAIMDLQAQKISRLTLALAASEAEREKAERERDDANVALAECERRLSADYQRQEVADLIDRAQTAEQERVIGALAFAMQEARERVEAWLRAEGLKGELRQASQSPHWEAYDAASKEFYRTLKDAARKRSEEGLPAQNPRSPVVQTENK